MGWLARLFGRERRDRPAFKAGRRKREAPPVAPPEATDDPDWAWRTLVAWWDRTRSDIPIAGASDEAIEALERRYDIILPPDFRAYLANAVPSCDDIDCEIGTWWPLGRIRNIPEEYPHPVGGAVRDQGRRTLFFLDYSFWCCAWAICCEPGDDWGKVLLISGGDQIVADSFSDFVAAYTSDPWLML
ncbi:hypothetical protein ASE70_08760 [Sphingomonas sp. Leaf22]|uniref:SMI1/KNR4 family protein n=1 Tax=Sphingomonas sp. Leaf22 TaxID=1735687 RepID=UPI0006FB27A8|nr:SMI1/KNR4 family protein [Sphingomonas sp. Leaf22]KQM76838.1 hypothetical protein ASE70_08760 [Sphingomonas sp. Leaf22]